MTRLRSAEKTSLEAPTVVLPNVAAPAGDGAIAAATQASNASPVLRLKNPPVSLIRPAPQERRIHVQERPCTLESQYPSLKSANASGRLRGLSSARRGPPSTPRGVPRARASRRKRHRDTV